MKKGMSAKKIINITIIILFLFLIGGFLILHDRSNCKRALVAAQNILYKKYSINFEFLEPVYTRWTVYRDDNVPKYSRNTYRLRAYDPNESNRVFWVILDEQFNYITDEY